MKIVRVITRLNVGGPGRTAVHDSVALARAGVDSVLVVGSVDRSEQEIAWQADGVRVVHLPELVRPLRPFADAAAFRGLRRLLAREQPDLVHTHLAKAGALARLAAVSLARRPLLVHTYHGHILRGYFSRPVTRAVLAAERWLARRTQRLIAVSARVQRELVDEFRVGDDQRFRVVEGGAPDRVDGHVARAPARAHLGLPDAGPCIAVPARLAPIKGHEIVIDALALLRARGRLVTACFLGDGPERQRLAALAAARGVADLVVFAGFVREPRRLYAAFDLIALPSHNEGFPMALLEALLEGVPVVATRTGGVADLVVDGEDGLLAPPGDAAAFADRLAALAADPVRARAMGARARARLAGRYTPENHRRKLFAVYAELLPALPSSATPAAPEIAERCGI
jgi:glycosyltransferase involved in cell wall biosynthesis